MHRGAFISAVVENLLPVAAPDGRLRRRFQLSKPTGGRRARIYLALFPRFVRLLPLLTISVINLLN